MNEKHKWLLDQLPEWVDSGLLSAEKARLVQQQYQSASENEPAGLQSKPLAPMVITAAFIVALGIWVFLDSLKFTTDHAPSGLLTAALLLGIPTALMVWSLLPNKIPTKLYFIREPCIILHSVCTAISLGVLADVFGLSDSTASFIFKDLFAMLVWMVLQLPLMFIVRSHVVPFLFAIALFVASFSWTFEFSATAPTATGLGLVVPILTMWAFIAIFLFHARSQINSLGQSHPRLQVLYLWAVLMMLAAGFFIPVTSVDKYTSFVLGGLFYASLFAVGRRYFQGFAESFEFQYRYRPFEMVGLLGIAAISFYFSFMDGAGQAAFDTASLGLSVHLSLYPASLYMLFVVLLALWLASVAILIRGKDFGALPIALFPLVLLASAIMPALGFAAEVLQWLFVYYLVLGLALWMILTGIASFQHQVLNTGMVILMLAVIVAVFEDISSSGTLFAYAILFMLAVGVLLIHLIRQRRKRQPDAELDQDASALESTAEISPSGQ